MLCTEAIAVKRTDAGIGAVTIHCNSWSCEVCNPRRAQKLYAQIAAGRFDKFWTFTTSQQHLPDPAEAERRLKDAFGRVILRIKRRWRLKKLDYFWTLELTKAGWPHLHVVMDAPYVPQKLVSAWMSELATSPVVWVRGLRGKKQAARYLSKYCAKNPTKVAGGRRYGCSKTWPRWKQDTDCPIFGAPERWEILRMTLEDYLAQFPTVLVDTYGRRGSAVVRYFHDPPHGRIKDVFA